MADELNFQVPREGYDSYLYGIIPDDQAVLAGAFSTSMQQVRNLDKVSLPDFAKVAFSIESTVGLPLTAGTDIPVDTPLSTAAKIKTALGSGIYGTYTTSNFFGAMSGLPYPWVNLYDKIKELETSTLRTIYQNLYLAVQWEQAGNFTLSYVDDGLGNYTLQPGVALPTNKGGGYGRENQLPTPLPVPGGTVYITVGTDPNDLTNFGKITGATATASGTTGSPSYSIAAPLPYDALPSADPPIGPTGGWPGMNSVVQGYIDDANNEIQAITVSSAENFNASNILNVLWNITGIALKHEQRARYIAMAPVPVPWDNRVASYPTSLYVMVDGIPEYAKQTEPHMAAQTLEHISDLLTTGGQSIVAMMRQERNQDRLAEIGIELDNNLKNSLDDQLNKQLLVNGTLSGAVEGIESPDGRIYTLPAWPENVEPYAFWDCNINGLRQVTDTTEGNILPILDGTSCPVVNTEVPIGPSVPIDIDIGIFIDDTGNVPNFAQPDPLPPELDTTYTASPLSPSTYNVNDAIDKVIECNCDCWVN